MPAVGDPPLPNPIREAALALQVEQLERKVKLQQKLISNLQRSKARKDRHLIGLMDAADRRQGEVNRLARKMMGIYRVLQLEDPMTDKLKIIDDILHKSIPRAIREYEERRASA